jgi:hypothetical protein
VPAFVLPGQLAVYPYGSAVVNRPEVQQQAAAVPGAGDLKFTLVPDHRMLAGVADAAFRRFEAERNQNVAAQALVAQLPTLFYTNVLVIKLELPSAIQI